MGAMIEAIFDEELNAFLGRVTYSREQDALEGG